MDNKYIPEEISLELSGSEEIVHLATFAYYDGKNYCKEKDIKQGTDWRELYEGNIHMVAVGKVLVVVPDDSFPDIERKNKDILFK